MAPLVVALVLLSPAAGPSATELLARGEKALADLEYDLAADELMRAATAQDATPEQRLRAHLLAGTANRIAGRDVDAQLNFRYVLKEAPETRLPEGTPPKVETFFEAVRMDMQTGTRTTAAPPVPAPVTAAAPVAPAPVAAPPVVEAALAPAAGGGPPLGLVIAGGGAAVGVLGGLGLMSAEVLLLDPAGDGDTRGDLQTLGVLSAGALGLGLVVAAAGGGLWASGVLP